MQCALQTTLNIDHYISCSGNGTQLIWRGGTHKEPTNLINVANNLPQIIIGNSCCSVGAAITDTHAPISDVVSVWSQTQTEVGRGLIVDAAADEKAGKRAPLQMCTASEMSNLGGNGVDFSRSCSTAVSWMQTVMSRALKRLHDAQLNQFMRLGPA